MSKPELWENPAFVTRVDEWFLRGKPKQNPIDWNANPWIEAFPEHAPFLKELRLQSLGYLGRDLVRETLLRYADDGKYLEGFLAVMIWGYADDARGPFRTKRILDQPRAIESITEAFHSLAQEDISSAYNSLVTSGPDHLGPAFATKYLYFAAPEEMNPQPVILDSLVAQGLDLWSNYKVSSTSATAKQYLNFLDYIATSAENLKISSEELELLIFSEVAKLNGNQSWANRQQIKDITHAQRKAWGILLASEIMLRVPEAVLLQTQPGGGQYDCFSIRGKTNTGTLEADFNLNGSIHFFKPVVQHYEWEELIERGAASTCEMLAESFGWDQYVNQKESKTTANAFRKLAKLAIQNITNPDWDFNCMVNDSSVHGLTINHEVLARFPGLPSDLSEYPVIEGMPKEAWFWVITRNHQIDRIFNSFMNYIYERQYIPT